MVNRNKCVDWSRCFLLIVITLLNLVIIEVAISQEVFLQTGFEEFATGNPPKDWEVIGGDFEVSGDTVKTGKKALAILGRVDLGGGVETDSVSP